MVAQQVHLPNGQLLTVTPIFGGYTFRSTSLDLHHSAFPPGWTVILQTEDEVDDLDEQVRRRSRIQLNRGPHDDASENISPKTTVVHRFSRPTLQHDSLYLSSISLPSSSDFKQSASPTRTTALMLWATLYWYFHKEAPHPQTVSESSILTPMSGRPKADWRIKIRREGIFKGKNTLQKLERMGLIASEDSCVGTDMDVRNPSGWAETFVSRRAFWQTDPRIFLFDYAPLQHSPFPTASPYPSRPSSPDRVERGERGSPRPADFITDANAAGMASPGGPFQSGSHLPTFYPPPPTQFTFTNHIRHPIRPKPPRQGETFYTRWIPSFEQWLSFRVPTLSSKAVPYFGPSTASVPNVAASFPGAASVATLPTLASFYKSSDTDILHKWMNEPRVNAAWGCAGPIATQKKLLDNALSSKHSFPIIGCWDGKPFGYFEIYWAKEDKLGRLLGGEVGNYTRGLHVLVGEQEFRGPNRVKVWLSALIHYCWMADVRSETVLMEPRIDNTK